jgi:gliding motility-associated-like protein
MRINDDGDVLWSKKFPTWMVTYSSEDADGNIVVTGINWTWQTYVMKIDQNGELIWYRDLVDFGGYGMFIKNISNGDIMVTSVQEGSGSFYAARLTSNGDILWSKNFGSEWHDTDHSAFSNKGLIDEETNSFYVVSPYFDNWTWEEDIMITKLNLASGELIWAKRLGGSSLDQSRDIVKTKNGYAVLGHTLSFQAEIDLVNHIEAPIINKNIMLFEFNSEGEILWSKLYGGEGDEKGIALQKTKENGFLISAYTSSAFFGNEGFSFDPLFFRTDSLGRIGCQMKEIDLPNSNVTIITTDAGLSIQNSIFLEEYFIQRASYTPLDDYVCQDCISVPEFSVNEVSLCVNETFHFENTTTIGLKCFQQWVIDGKTFNGSENINYQFNEPGVYPVQLISSCSNENNVYSMNVIVANSCDEDQIIENDTTPIENQFYVPNTFTNNGDHLNQEFQAIFAMPDQISEFEFTIYNRWGEIIYFSKNLFESWDGSYNQSPCSQGIYGWQIKYKFRGQNFNEHGRVALVR